MSETCERRATAICGCVMQMTVEIPSLDRDEIERGVGLDVCVEDVELDEIEIVTPCRAHMPIPVDQRVMDSELTKFTPVNVLVTVDDCNHVMFRRTDLFHELIARSGVPVRSVIVVNTELGLAASTRDPAV